MSVSSWGLLRRQIADGEQEQAVRTVHTISETQKGAFSDSTAAIHHAVNAGQPEVALALLDGSRKCLNAVDSATFSPMVGAMTGVLAACRRGKQEETARKAVTLVLELLAEAPGSALPEAAAAVARFAGSAGQYALRCKDASWFGEIALQTAGWAAKNRSPQSDELLLEAVDSWLHRILRQSRPDMLPAVFEAVAILYAEAPDKKKLLTEFLHVWRAVAAMACLNPENPMASQLVEQLLVFVSRCGDAELWSPVSEKIGDVASLAVAKYGITETFAVFRPLLDAGRIQLGDELKFGTGPDPDSLRQHIIRRIGLETLRIADMAAHTDISSVAGDKLEEMYCAWIQAPQFEPHIRSIQRYCQLLLVFWSHNRKRAARRWAPREKSLSEPVLLTDADQAKLSFLL